MEKAIAKSKKRKFKNLPLFMIALPGIVYLLINNYIPMFGIFLAFKNYSLRKGVQDQRCLDYDQKHNFI